MSTNGTIAKPESDGWCGKYHHSDSYPSGLGLYLFHAHRDYFGGDTKAMVEYLVDGELVGWSSIIDRDLSAGPSWDGDGPQSYTARGETPLNSDGDWIRSVDGPDIFNEWIYVLTPGGLMVIDGDGHRFKALVRWDDPDGEAIILGCEE